MNSYTQGSSGGDVLFVELTKRWNGVEHTICTSALGEQFCRMKGLTNAHFVISTQEKEFRGVITTYILRILIGLRIAFNFQFLPDIIYVSSDIPCDTFPACVLKIRAKIAGKTCKWVQKFYRQVCLRRYAKTVVKESRCESFTCLHILKTEKHLHAKIA